MKFKLFPVLNRMIDFYHKPKGTDRFEAYLKMLKGASKDDIEIPIPYFNPMGKEHVLNKLLELKKLNVEEIIQQVLKEFNKNNPKKTSIEIKVAMSLADDLKGAWTNKYTTDYESKFKLNSYINRNFCIPVFWTSEEYNLNKLKRRTEEYCLRTLCWNKNHKPITLAEHITQEIFVAKHCKTSTNKPMLRDFTFVDKYYQKNKNTTNYSRIFNFLYGDNFCKELGYAEYGIKEELTGFKYAKQCSENNPTNQAKSF